MPGVADLLAVALVGLGTTSSALVGVAVGLRAPLSKKVLAGILAFAAGALIGALAIELAFEGAQELRRLGFDARAAWAFVGGGFALGAIVYYLASHFLESRGAAVRYQTQFHEYAVGRKQDEAKELIGLLSHCELLRHLPAEDIEELLPSVHMHRFEKGEVVFREGDPGDALYIVARGGVEVTFESGETAPGGEPIRLGPGQAFGEMALLSGGPRTATVWAREETELVEIKRADFERLVAEDPEMARAVERLSHSRAIRNITTTETDAAAWARLASTSLERVSRAETNRMLEQAGQGAGLAIVFGNILDTIPGCLVIGAKFEGMETLSLTLVLGMFLGGIPEAAASSAMLKRAGFREKTIFALWSAVLVAGVCAAVAGKLFIGGSESLAAVFAEALAGGALLALVVHAMVPEAIHDGGSQIVLPTVAGFLFALYLALAAA
jgi:CRP-like cAMP-binding protein